MMFGNMGSKRWDVPITRFIERVAKADTPPPGPNYRAELTSIVITGDIAAVQLVEQDYFGMDFANLFTLARFEDGWRIVAKAYTSPGARSA